MATLNGRVVSFEGLSFRQIGELLLKASAEGDGSGLRLELHPWEEQGFQSVTGMFVGRGLAELVTDAVEKEKGIRPEFLNFRYENRIFTT